MGCSTITRALGWGALLLLGFDYMPQANGLPKTPWAQQRAKGHGRKALSHAINKRQFANTSEPGDCVPHSPLDIEAPKENIWSGLTGPEAAGVTEWLFAQKELNLTLSENATSVLVELMQPNKSDALAYIDGGGPAPPRYAHVLLDFRATEDPEYQDILVGPLPVTNGTTKWERLEYPYTRKTSGRVRNLDADDEAMQEWLYKAGRSVADITKDLWNATALGLENDTLSIWGIDPYYQDGGRVQRWDTFWSIPNSIFDVGSMMPMGLFFMSDVTGRDPSKWIIEGWYYNGIFYETTEEFRNAYWSGNVEKLGGNFAGDWSATDQQGEILPRDTMAPPTSVAPQGARYSVDPERKYVEWMGWTFYVGFNRDTGMALYDISYKGQRILYELGLQEALAHYAGKSFPPIVKEFDI
ncbi:copper amine oxidase [Colletotrichum tofieldiae]|nr:copper amine oxidase [Colletotrichum tofieldiae]